MTLLTILILLTNTAVTGFFLVKEFRMGHKKIKDIRTPVRPFLDMPAYIGDWLKALWAFRVFAADISMTIFLMKVFAMGSSILGAAMGMMLSNAFSIYWNLPKKDKKPKAKVAGATT